MGEKKKTEKKFITKERIISLLIGLVIGIAITILAGFLFDFFAKSTGIAKLKYGEEVLVTVDGKSISTQDLYDTAKSSYGLDLMISKIDSAILNDMYELTEKEEEEVKEEAAYYIDYYTSMGYSEEEFLSGNGFATYEDFLNDIRIGMKSNKYLYDYLEGKLEKDAVQNYYNENKDTIETYDSEHVLVKITDEVTDEQALALANEILNKVKEGKTFEDIVAEYGDRITHEELGYQGLESGLEEAYITALKSMEDGKYSETPVKTSYGYHIIHKISTASFEDLRGSIIETLSQDILTEDTYLTYKAFVELREEKNLEIHDEDLKAKYEEYVELLNEEADHEHTTEDTTETE